MINNKWNDRQDTYFCHLYKRTRDLVRTLSSLPFFGTKHTILYVFRVLTNSFALKHAVHIVYLSVICFASCISRDCYHMSYVGFHIKSIPILKYHIFCVCSTFVHVYHCFFSGRFSGYSLKLNNKYGHIKTRESFNYF